MTMQASPSDYSAKLVTSSPVGDLVLLATDQGLGGLFFGHRIEYGQLPAAGDAHPVLLAAETQLSEYFAGHRKNFDLPLDPAGTDFQRAVWQQLCRIPFGETASYRDIAERIGNPGAVRAVGMANGANPISIVVPCHRVIGADGSLTGFGGGLDIKHRLLQHEGVLLGIG